MASTIIPTADYFKECFYFEEISGLLIWQNRPESHFNNKSRHKRFITMSAGKPAGTLNKHLGYLVTNINGITYLNHRIAWLIYYGEWPDVIDHIDGNKTNNCLSNLRSGTQSLNTQNTKAARKHSQTGIKGVGFDKRKNCFVSAISVNRKKIHIGTFKSPQEAHKAYLEYKRALHEYCTI